MNIAICDDEQAIREQINGLIVKEKPGVCPELYETGGRAACRSTIAWDYDEPVYETQTVSEWKIDTPAWTENVPCGETCSVCGATK